MLLVIVLVLVLSTVLSIVLLVWVDGVCRMVAKFWLW
jgi:hypothetical protein